MLYKICISVYLLCIPFQTLAMDMANANNIHPVRIQLKWKHQFQFAGFYMALEKGFYHDAGLDVRLIEGGPKHQPVPLLLQEKADYAVTDTGAMISRGKGQLVKVIAVIFQQSPLILISRDDLDISKPENLHGKRIMMLSGDQMPEVIAALQRAGIKNSDYIRQPISFNIEDLLKGKTDAYGGYSTNEPYYFYEHHLKYHIFRPIDFGIDFYGDVLITSDKEITQHPEHVKAIKDASIKGWQYALSHIDETIALIQQKYNTQHKSYDALLFEANAIRDLMMPDFVNVGYMNINRWQSIAKVYQEQGLLDKDFAVADFIYHPQPTLWQSIHKHQKVLWALLACFIFIISLMHFLHLKRAIRMRTYELERINKHLNQEISEHKLTEEKLRKAIIKADKANLAKSEFLAVMSHELRTPIHGIVGTLDMLAESNLNAEDHINLEYASSATRSLQLLVDDILDLSKIESGAMTLNITPFLLNPCIHDVMSTFILTAREKNIRLEAYFHHVPSILHGDMVRIRQVLINLIGNAVKFTHKGYVRLDMRYQENILEFAIKDTGIGISQEEQEQIFEPFTQSQMLMEREHDGTGLGTTIVKRFADLMHAQVHVQSVLGEGSTFTFKLPCEMEGDTMDGEWHMQTSKQPKLRPIQPQSNQTWRILLAEDDPISRRIAYKRLSKAGFILEVAEDGLQAWEYFQNAWHNNQHYDFVLLDIRMPNMDGMSVTRHIRSLETAQGNEKHTPILGLSAHATEEIRQQCLNAGMDDFLIKPVDPDTIMHTIKSMLETTK